MIETGLYDRLKTFVGLTDLTSDRIYASHIPQNSPYPCVAYRKISGRPRQLLKNDTDVFDTDFDVAAFDKTYDGANVVANQIVQALQRYSGTNNGVVIMDVVINDISNDYEFDLEIFEVVVSVKITHRGL